MNCRGKMLLGVLAVVLLPAVVSAGDLAQLPWVVWQCDLRDVSGVNDSIVADFESADEAETFAIKRYRSDKGSHLYLPLHRSERDGTKSWRSIHLALLIPESNPIVDPPLMAPFLGPAVYDSF